MKQPRDFWIHPEKSYMVSNDPHNPDFIHLREVLPIPESVEEAAYEYAEKRAKHFGTWNEQDVLNAKVCFQEGYELGRNHANAELEEQCKINAIGAQRELKLMAEIERLKAKLSVAADALKSEWVGQYGAVVNTHNKQALKQITEEEGEK